MGAKVPKGQGHTADCPRFEDLYPWQCDCQAKAEATAVEAASRYAIEPQRDVFAGTADGADGSTNFEICDEDKATQWAVFNVSDDLPGPDLVEDYPSRSAAEAAIAAMVDGKPAPAPEWPAAATPAPRVLLCIDGEIIEADENGDETDVLIATVFGPSANGEDLGPMLAASCELYAELFLARDEVADTLRCIVEAHTLGDDISTLDDDAKPDVERLTAQLARIDAALAKAKGSSAGTSTATPSPLGSI